jgi:hypothetical protein
LFFKVVEHSGTLELAALHLGEAPAVAATAVGQLVSSFTLEICCATLIVNQSPTDWCFSVFLCIRLWKNSGLVEM